MSWRSKQDQAPPEEPPAPTADDDVLAQRLTELTHREVALRRITEAVEKQRTRLEERERALATSAAEAAARDKERDQESARRAERAEQRVRELEQRVAELEALPEPASEEPLPAPPAAALESETTEGTYTLQRLERLVEEARRRGDPQAEEWAYYLPLLREHAEPDGRLPAQFASLVDSIFAG